METVQTNSAAGIAAITGGNSWFVPTGGNSASAVSAPADTSEDTLATITIPPLSANAVIRVTALWTFTNNANNKVLRVRFSGAAGASYMGLTRTTQQSATTITVIENRAATGSQVGNTVFLDSASSGETQAAHVTTSIDTSVATSIVLTGTKASAGDTLTLESYLVEILKP